jgi:hypothetical protein
MLEFCNCLCSSRRHAVIRTTFPHEPQLFGSLWRLKHEIPHSASPVGHTDAVAVTVAVVVVTGVRAVVVMAVIPPQEQAILYLAVPEQALAYVGTLIGDAVTCLCSKESRRQHPCPGRT